MKIAIGCDHIATDIKNQIITYLKEQNYKVIDCGTYDKVRTHYPIFGHKVASLVALKKVDKGIVICGTGVGISNSANKTKGIRAALVRDIIATKEAVSEYNVNIIACGARITGIGLILEIIDTFLKTKYKPTDIKEKRIEKINSLIKINNYNEHIFDKENKKWAKNEYSD